MTKIPKSYLSDEERKALFEEGGEHLVCIAESQEADDAGDDDASWAWLAATKLSASTLNLFKETIGLDKIKEKGLNLDNAIAEYGEDWLKS